MEAPSATPTSTAPAITHHTVLDHVQHRACDDMLLSALVLDGVPVAQMETCMWRGERGFADLSPRDQRRIRYVMWDVYRAHCAGLQCDGDQVEAVARANRSAHRSHARAHRDDVPS